MKKIYLFTLLTFTTFLSYSQCIPDPNWNTDGISPSILPNGNINTEYSTIISFKTPKDSTLVISGQTYNATIDSAKAETIKNVPPGFTWACNVSNCTWKGGDKGCALLSGKADSNNFRFYEIKVYVRSWITVEGLGFQLERLDSSTIDFYITGGKNSVQNISPTPKYTFYPNPVKNILQIETQNLIEKTTIVTITDLTGKVLITKTLQVGNGIIDVADLPKGLHLINFKNSNYTSTQKLVIE